MAVILQKKAEMFKKKWILILGFFCLACGKTNFNLGYQNQLGSAPGSFSIPPKVDILLLQSNTAAGANSFSVINAQIQSFLNQLSAAKWDFHFAAIPAAPSTTSTPMFTQVAGSQYDSNSPSYVAPYVGAPVGGVENLASSFFTTFSNYQLMAGSTFNFASGSTESGFRTLYWTLKNGLGSSNFLRPDALLFVLAVSETDDTSSINYCESGGTKICELVGKSFVATGTAGSDPTWISQYGASGDPGTYTASFNYYANAFKTSWPQMSFYAAVSPNINGFSCNGSNAFKGTRYIQMAGGSAINYTNSAYPAGTVLAELGSLNIGNLSAGLNGKSFDICQGGIKSVYSQFYASLQIQVLTRTQKYVFIQQQPNPSTIQVNRLVGGNSSNAVSIPQDPNNGWQYVGMQTGVYAYQTVLNGVSIDLNQASGYAIKLSGSGMISGSDLVQVIYQPQI